MDKSTGDKLLVDGKEAIAEKKFTPENASGTEEIAFTLDEYERDIPELDDGERKAEINLDVVRKLMTAKAEALPHVVKGIDDMLLMAKGYTCREIGKRMGASDNLASAYVSKARKFLKGRPKPAQMMEIYAA